jgi:hypothetical protein
MTFCCDAFQDLLESAGRRGLSIMVTDSRSASEGYTFLCHAITRPRRDQSDGVAAPTWQPVWG